MEAESICGPIYHRVATLPKTKPKQYGWIAHRGDSCGVKRFSAFHPYFLDRKEQMKTKTSKSTKTRANGAQWSPGRIAYNGRTITWDPSPRADRLIKKYAEMTGKSDDDAASYLVNACVRMYLALTPKNAKLIADDSKGTSLHQSREGQYFLWHPTAFLDGKRMGSLDELHDTAPELFGSSAREAKDERARRIRKEYHAVKLTDKEVLEWMLKTQVATDGKEFIRQALKKAV